MCRRGATGVPKGRDRCAVVRPLDRLRNRGPPADWPARKLARPQTGPPADWPARKKLARPHWPARKLARPQTGPPADWPARRLARPQTGPPADWPAVHPPVVLPGRVPSTRRLHAPTSLHEPADWGDPLVPGDRQPDDRAELSVHADVQRIRDLGDPSRRAASRRLQGVPPDPSLSPLEPRRIRSPLTPPLHPLEPERPDASPGRRRFSASLGTDSDRVRLGPVGILVEPTR